MTPDYLVESVSVKLISGLYTQRRTGKFCDIKIQINGTILWAHSCVLSTFSAKLHNLFVTRQEKNSRNKRAKTKFYVNFSLNNPLEITLKDLCDSADPKQCECLECVDKVLDFLYHGRVALGEQIHIDHIETLGEIFGIPELVTLCYQARANAPEASEVVASTLTYEQNSQSIEPEQKQNKPGKTCTGGRAYSCLGCGTTHRNVAALLKHMRESTSDTSHSLTCSLCLKYTAPNVTEFVTHLDHHDHALPFFCLACDARFRTRTALSSHEPRHSTETPYLCSECGRGFKWKHALRSHSLVHTEEKRHLCDTCGFSTAHISTFRTHKMVHAGACFRCPQPNCQFVASRKQSLAHHMVTHSKERIYQCEVCGQSFSMYKNLRRHAVRHEPSPAGLVCCPVPGCLYANTRLDKIKEHAERHRSGKPVRSILMPRVRRTTPVPAQPPPLTLHQEVIHLRMIENTPMDESARPEVLTISHIDETIQMETGNVTQSNNSIAFNEFKADDIYIVLPPPPDKSIVGVI